MAISGAVEFMLTLRAAIDGLRTCFSLPRLCVAGLAALGEFALFSLSWEDPLWYLGMAVGLPALAALLAYGLFEHWPRQLPDRLPHWVLQVAGVALAIVLTLAALYLLNTEAGAPPFWQVRERLQSYVSLTFLGLLLGPWLAMAALIADDEPLLRASLRRQLAECWPELAVVAEARNGPEALALFELHQPAICFLDVHMPGLSGVDVASKIGRRAHLVFVTAFDQYAVRAFEQGALDYLVKPVQLARLAGTVTRVRERLAALQPGVASVALLQELAASLRAAPAAAPPPAALAARLRGSGHAADSRRRCRLPQVRRQVHLGCLARWRQARRSAAAQYAQGIAGATRYAAVSADPPGRRGQSARRSAGRARHA